MKQLSCRRWAWPPERHRLDRPPETPGRGRQNQHHPLAAARRRAPIWIAERHSLMASSHAIPHLTRVWGASRLRSVSPTAAGPSWNSIMRATSKLQHVEVLHPPRADHPGTPVLNHERGSASPAAWRGADQADGVGEMALSPGWSGGSPIPLDKLYSERARHP